MAFRGGNEYERITSMTLPKKIVFCLPGKSFSTNFFNSWNATIAELNKANVSYAYSTVYDPVIYFARNRILGGSNTAGKKQQPWQGNLPYDKMVWIDSDIVWRPEDLIKLIQHDKPIVAGTYLMNDNINHPVVEKLDFDHLADTGVFKFINRAEMLTKKEVFKASYTGFGFVAIKHGVIETLEYPWFQPRWVTNEKFHDFCAEDVGFCWAAQELGHEIWIDPSIKVGHEKNVIL